MCYNNDENNFYDCYAIHNNHINYDIILGEYGIQHPDYIYRAQYKSDIDLDYCENIIGEYISWYSSQYNAIFEYFTQLHSSQLEKYNNFDYNVLYKLGDLYWRHKCLRNAIEYIYNNYTIKEDISETNNKELYKMNKDKKQEFPFILNKIEDILYTLQSDTILNDVYTNDYKQYLLKNIYEIAIYMKEGIVSSH